MPTRELEVRLVRLGQGAVGIYVQEENVVALNLDSIVVRACLETPGDSGYFLLLSSIILLDRTGNGELRELEHLATELISGRITLEQFEATK